MLAVLAFTAFGQTGNRFQRATPSTTESDAVQARTENDGYVGSKACGECHSGIYREYMQTGMGRSISSMSSVSTALLEKLHVPAVYSNQRLDRHYNVIARDGKLYESEYALDGSGTEMFARNWLEWIVGAGAMELAASSDGAVISLRHSHLLHQHQDVEMSPIRIDGRRI
jgi:hypothetical protein